MLDTKLELVEALEDATDLNVYYELIVDDTCTIPCITYMSANDKSHKEGDTLRYGEVTYTVKLWCNVIADMVVYLDEIDTAMKTLGYVRDSATELFANNTICTILTYTAKYKEEVL